MLEKIFEMQKSLNDMTFSKKAIFNNNGEILTCQELMEACLIGEKDNSLGPNGLTNQWLRKYLEADNDESRELSDELPWKWWSKDTLNMQNIRVELIDKLHFLVSMMITAGLTAEDVYRIYEQKMAVNIKRQEEGYSKATKDEADSQHII